MTNEIENNNNTQSTGYIDPDVEFLIEDYTERKRKEAEKKAARNARNAPKSDFPSPAELSPQDQGIRPKKATNALDNSEEPLHIIPALDSLTKDQIFAMQKMYIDAGMHVYPVCALNDGYYKDCNPNTRPGLTAEELRSKIYEGNICYFRAMIDCGMIIIDLDRKNGKDGVATFNSWLEEKGIRTGLLRDIDNGSYPFTTRSSSGGLHLYFNAPLGMEGLTSLIGIMPGVDILMYGRAIVTAGSRKSRGGIYSPNYASLTAPRPTIPPALTTLIFCTAARIRIDQALRGKRGTESSYGGDGSFGPKCPEKLIGWNLRAWDRGKRGYGGHNDFFMRTIAECKFKKKACENGEAEPSLEWELDRVWDAIKNCEYFREWGDLDKENQIGNTFQFYYKDRPQELKTRFGGYIHGN